VKVDGCGRGDRERGLASPFLALERNYLGMGTRSFGKNDTRMRVCITQSWNERI
jgi:hypothetical protein